MDEYDSVEKLVEYLNFLDKNDDEYKKYFRWREVLEAFDENPELSENVEAKLPNYEMFWKSTALGFCDLCQKLVNNSLEPKVIPSLHSYWYSSEHRKCFL